MADTTETTKSRRVLQGVVTSDKMNKTIVVAVQKRNVHRLYKKYIKLTKKVKAHDEENSANIGDTVRVVEHRPLSKEKHWALLEIVERAR
jgi:small subunit ribosomal protein S17